MGRLPREPQQLPKQPKGKFKDETEALEFVMKQIDELIHALRIYARDVFRAFRDPLVRRVKLTSETSSLFVLPDGVEPAGPLNESLLFIQGGSILYFPTSAPVAVGQQFKVLDNDRIILGSPSQVPGETYAVLNVAP